MALLHLKEKQIKNIEIVNPFTSGSNEREKEGILQQKNPIPCARIKETKTDKKQSKETSTLPLGKTDSRKYMGRGRGEGEILKLISQVKKKKLKGDSIAKIADDLVEEITKIQPIFNAITEHPKATKEEIYDRIKNTNLMQSLYYKWQPILTITLVKIGCHLLMFFN